ncbi:hypothetical protein MNV49_003594 [Pseudohyphozyma bogoriensis]|nr:hypothetical protein MNV49_003594 [Pseudohyphozyma bogoriensis]
MAPKKSRSSTSSSALSSSFKATKTGTFPASKSKPSAATSSASSLASSSTKKGEPSPSADEHTDLDPWSYANTRVYKQAKLAMGKPIHGDAFNPVHIILRVFDTQEEYGPCSNATRLERYERAVRFGLDPPEEIGDILRSNDGRRRPDYSMSTFQI